MPSICSICHEKSSGTHYGAEACRGCTAFFRKSVTMNMKYRCRGNNDCDITVKNSKTALSDNHSMCRACRYSKCLSVGMNVSKRPGNIRKPMSTPKKINLDQPGNSSLLLEDLPPNFKDQVPFLTKMKENYQKLVDTRLVIHKDEGAPRALNYMEPVEQGKKDVGLVADWISECFEDFVKLQVEQKNILFRNFSPKFSLLEATFRSHIRHSPDKITLPSGDYIDMNSLDTFFNDKERDTQMTKEEIERLFKPTCDMQRNSLILPMMSHKLDIFEFFALITILLLDTGLENQTEECEKTGEQVKEQVMTELVHYMKHYKRIEEPGIRIASIVNLLPAAERCVRKIQDDMEMTQMRNVLKVSKEFYDLVNGIFC